MTLSFLFINRADITLIFRYLSVNITNKFSPLSLHPSA